MRSRIAVTAPAASTDRTVGSPTHQVNGALSDQGRKLLRFKQKQWGALMGLNVLIAGVLPLGFNILFTNWRHAREKRDQNAVPPALPQAPPSPLIRRPAFEQWCAGARAGL